MLEVGDQTGPPSCIEPPCRPIEHAFIPYDAIHDLRDLSLRHLSGRAAATS